MLQVRNLILNDLKSKNYCKDKEDGIVFFIARSLIIDQTKQYLRIYLFTKSLF